jgi:hypothetical protein
MFGNEPRSDHVTKNGVQSMISATAAGSMRSKSVTPGLRGAGWTGAVVMSGRWRASAKRVSRRPGLLLVVGLAHPGLFGAEFLDETVPLRRLRRSLQTVVTSEASPTWTIGPS